MNVGMVILIVLCFTTLCQLIMQGSERRKQHRELLEQLDQLKSLGDR